MAKFNSLEDLKALLSEEERQAVEENAPQPERTGYDGRPQVLQVVLDSKRRRGKTVTLVSGFQVPAGELEQIAQSLKKACGAGGQVLENAIEIQGDHRARVTEKLQALGFRVRA